VFRYISKVELLRWTSTVFCRTISTVLCFSKGIINGTARGSTLIRLFLWAGLVLLVSEFAPSVIGTALSLPVSERGAAALVFTDLLLLISVMVCILFYQHSNGR